MINGKCLCGAVHYTYSGELTEVVICHCSQCKLAQGTVFATNSPVQTALFEIQQGENRLKSYFSSDNKRRVFCSECGSPLFSQRTDKPEVIRLRLGTVTKGYIPPPAYEIYSKSKSEWLSCDAGLEASGNSYWENKP